MTEVTAPLPFDLTRDVRFRGKPIPALTKQELRAALIQALERVHFLEETRPLLAYTRHGDASPAPLPPKSDFTTR